MTEIKGDGGKMADAQTVEQTLAERGSRYGDFADNARISQQLMAVLEAEPGFANWRDIHKEGAKFIFQKLSRAVNGDPEYRDNWHDIGGYAKLVEDRCI